MNGLPAAARFTIIRNGGCDLFKDPKMRLRLIGFIMALVVAVAAFTVGVLQLGHRETGYYDVGLTADAQALAYGSGAHLLYYAEGGSSAIRQKLNAVQKVFSDALIGAWKLLDAEQTYDGVVNLASLNAHPGETMAVGTDLYAVLTDAAERTAAGEGYSALSGAIHAEWRALRYLETPEDFDPRFNADEAALLSALTAQMNAPGAATLELTAPDSAALRLSDECAAFLAENEIEGPVLDLNLLHDAYMLDMIARTLRADGLTNGCLYTESGCTLWLESREGRYTLVGRGDDGAATPIGAAEWPSPSSFVQFTAFLTDEESYGFYCAEGEDGAKLRHAWIDPAIGDHRDVLLSAYLAGPADALVELAYRMAALNALPDAEAVRDAALALPEDVFAAWTLQSDDGKKLYTRASDIGCVTLDADAGYGIVIE